MELEKTSKTLECGHHLKICLLISPANQKVAGKLSDYFFYLERPRNSCVRAYWSQTWLSFIKESAGLLFVHLRDDI